MHLDHLHGRRQKSQVKSRFKFANLHLKDSKSKKKYTL